MMEIREDQKKDARIAALEAELADTKKISDKWRDLFTGSEAELVVQRELRRTDNAAGAKLDEELRAELAEANAMLRKALDIHLHEDADADEYTGWLRSRVRAEEG